jgi:NAD-dependent deacetylase
MRPDVVWFGEALDPGVAGEASRLATAAVVCLVIGTSGVVYPAARLAELTTRSGGSVIEINVAPTPLTDVATVSLRGPAAAIVPQLLLDQPPAP